MDKPTDTAPAASSLAPHPPSARASTSPTAVSGVNDASQLVRFERNSRDWLRLPDSTEIDPESWCDKDDDAIATLLREHQASGSNFQVEVVRDLIGNDCPVALWPPGANGLAAGTAEAGAAAGTAGSTAGGAASLVGAAKAASLANLAPALVLGGVAAAGGVVAVAASGGSNAPSAQADGPRQPADNTPADPFPPPDLIAADDSGLSSTDDVTRVSTPAFVIPDAPAGWLTVVLVNGEPAATQHDADNGTWRLVEPVADGLHDIRYRYEPVSTDGSVGSPDQVSLPLVLTIDSVAPDAPTVPPDLMAAADAGWRADDDLTRVANAVFAAPALADGETPVLYINGVAVESVFDASAGTVTLVQALSDGTHDVTMAIVDAAGNVGLQGPSLELAIDTVAPTFSSAGQATVGERIATTVVAWQATTDETSHYALTGTDAGRFVFDASTGSLRFAVPPDYDAPLDANGDNVYDVTVVAMDAAGNTSSQAVQIAVERRAEADEWEVDDYPPIGEPAGGSGLLRETQSSTLALNAAAPQTGATGFAETPLLERIVAGLDSAVASAGPGALVTSAAVTGVPGYEANKTTGFIYLEAGVDYHLSSTIGGGALVARFGDTTVYAQNGPAGTPVAQVFTPAVSGFYTVDLYYGNLSGTGQATVLLNGAPLDTDHFLLYPNLLEVRAAAAGAGADGLSDLQGSRDGLNGFYTMVGAGTANTADPMYMPPIRLVTVDTDGSETETQSGTGLPIGAVLSDGVHTITVTSAPQTHPATR